MTRSTAALNTSRSPNRICTARLMNCGTCFSLSVLLVVALQAQTGQIQSAISLARQHRYKEAAVALKGVREPMERPQKIAFHRLKAAIASGLGDAASGAKEMEAALNLAPDDPILLHATAVAEAQAGLLYLALAHLEQIRSTRDSGPIENLIGD